MYARRGQSILEYTIIVGIVTLVLYYMGTSIKRGVQSLVKVAADQVGTQSNSDQDFNDIQQGYMVASNTMAQENRNKQVAELGYGYTPPGNDVVYVVNITDNESTDTVTNTITNAGFVPGA